MKQGITKISILVWAFTMLGFVGSTIHYHGESLHCLEHGHEPHISENDSLCPITVIKSTQPDLDVTELEAPIVQEDIEFHYQSFLKLEIHGQFKSKRAPPSLI